MESPREIPVEQIAILEANLDDLNPQIIGYIIDRAFAEGRAGCLHHAGADEEEPSGSVADDSGASGERSSIMRDLLFRESSTLGVRTRHEQRYALPRRHEVVNTPWGEVRMKIATLERRSRAGTRPSMKIAGALPASITWR